jgi:hypothetical protein
LARLTKPRTAVSGDDAFLSGLGLVLIVVLILVLMGRL